MRLRPDTSARAWYWAVATSSTAFHTRLASSGSTWNTVYHARHGGNGNSGAPGHVVNVDVCAASLEDSLTGPCEENCTLFPAFLVTPSEGQKGKWLKYWESREYGILEAAFGRR